MTHTMTYYSPEQRAEAVALARAVGPVKAAKQLGYPMRTVAHWAAGDVAMVNASPLAGAAIAKVEATIAQRLAEAHEMALRAVMDGLSDPKARLGDKAAALRVLGEQRALAEGRATSRSESLNVNIGPDIDPESGLTWDQRRDLADWIDANATVIAQAEEAEAARLRAREIEQAQQRVKELNADGS
jgi:hypothetical protein